MFFYILCDEHKDNYAAYYSGPTPFSGEIMAWDLDPMAFIGSSSLLTADQDIIIMYDKPSLPQNVNVCVNNVSDKLDVQINYRRFPNLSNRKAVAEIRKSYGRPIGFQKLQRRKALLNFGNLRY
jgi:hypothetical protein